MIRVVHCKGPDPWDTYIGRGNIIFGNLWSHKSGTKALYKVKTRKEAVDNYRKWLRGTEFKDVLPELRVKILKALPELKDKILSCWCEIGEECHGYVLIEMIDELK